MRTTGTESRDLEREGRTGINLRMEFEGAWEAVSARVDDEFGGSTRSAPPAALRAARLRRWGRSFVHVGGGMEAPELGGRFEDPSSAAIELPSAIVDVKFPLLEFDRAFSSIPLAEKYPARNFGVVPVTAA